MNIQFCNDKGLWVDWCISVDIRNVNHLIGKTLKFGYTFNYHKDPKPYKFEYWVDIVSKGEWMIWMHYDQDNSCSYVQTISQACPDDTIEFAINISSLWGLVDFKSIDWFSPEILYTPEANTLTYNKDMLNIRKEDWAVKIYADINWVCELEDSVVEWYNERYYENKDEIIDF